MRRPVNRNIRHTMALAACLGLAALALPGASQAQDRDRDQDRDRTQLRDPAAAPIYGSQLMTERERLEYRNRMRTLRTAEERERFREQHHEQMQERARERGVQLPDAPPVQGGRALQSGPGAGAGAGGGAGAGPGGGGPANRRR